MISFRSIFFPYSYDILHIFLPYFYTIYLIDGQQPEGAAIEDDSFNTFFTETGKSMSSLQKTRGKPCPQLSFFKYRRYYTEIRIIFTLFPFFHTYFLTIYYIYYHIKYNIR